MKETIETNYYKKCWSCKNNQFIIRFGFFGYKLRCAFCGVSNDLREAHLIRIIEAPYKSVEAMILSSIKLTKVRERIGR